jgi:replication-associated recombination protein RarA
LPKQNTDWPSALIVNHLFLNRSLQINGSSKAFFRNRSDEAKSISRRAALTFLAQKGSAIWRRFIIIAFEDIGAGSVDVVAMTVAASTDASWRKQSGGEAVVAAHLARLLAEAPKSRSAEHLITSSDQHPSLGEERLLVSASSIADNLNAVADKSNSLMHRALAAWCVSGMD